MKIICLLIVVTHLAFPPFENAFKLQYLASNLPNNWEKASRRPATGFGKTSNVNWKINDSNFLPFRYSTQKKKEISEKWKPEMGLQLDIVF